MSLVRLASLKPNIQNKIKPLIKQAKAGNFKSGHEALEYHIMGQVLKYEKVKDKGFMTLNEILAENKMIAPDFEDITLLSYQFSGDPNSLKDRHTGKIKLRQGQPFMGVHAEVRIVVSSPSESKSRHAQKMSKKIEFTWKPYDLFVFPPFNKIVAQMLVAEGYEIEWIY